MTKSNAKAPAKPNRQARRKEMTRRKLLTAAMEVFNEKGINDTTVNDITELADVAYGTFYNYFTSIEELAPQVIRLKVHDHLEQLKNKLKGHENIVVIVAISVRELAKKVMSDKTMHWLSERPVIMVNELMSSLYEDADAQHRIGEETGQFSLPGTRKQLHQFCSWGFTGMLQEGLKNPPDPDELADAMARIYLRVLGVKDVDVEKALAEAR